MTAIKKTSSASKEKLRAKGGAPVNDSEIPRMIKVLHEIAMNLKPLSSINVNLEKIKDQLEISNKLANLKMRVELERHQEQVENQFQYEKERTLR